MFSLDGIVTEGGGTVRVPVIPAPSFLVDEGMPMRLIAHREVTFTKRRYIFYTEPKGVLGAKPHTQRLSHWEYRYSDGPNAGWCNACKAVTESDGEYCFRHVWLAESFYCVNCKHEFFVGSIQDLWHDCLEARIRA